MRQEVCVAFKDIITSGNGGLLIANEKSQIVYAHRSFVKKTGFSLDQMIGQRPGRLWGGCMSKMFYYDLWQRISIQEKPFHDTVKNRRFSGEVYKEKLSIIPIRDSVSTGHLYIHLLPKKTNDVGSYRLDRIAEALNEKYVTHDLIRALFEIIGGDTVGFDSKNFAGSLSSVSVNDFLYDFFIKQGLLGYTYRIDDFILINKARADKRNFSLLYQKYYSSIRDYIKKRLISVNHITSEDLTQEVFLRAFRSIEDFNCENASYKTYLLRIAHNILVDIYRSNERIEYCSLNENIISKESSIIDSIYAFGLLSGLSFFERDIFLRKHYYGYGLQEIADYYGISLDALKARLRRIKNKLQKLK